MTDEQMVNLSDMMRSVSANADSVVALARRVRRQFPDDTPAGDLMNRFIEASGDQGAVLRLCDGIYDPSLADQLGLAAHVRARAARLKAAVQANQPT